MVTLLRADGASASWTNATGKKFARQNKKWPRSAVDVEDLRLQIWMI